MLKLNEVKQYLSLDTNAEDEYLNIYDSINVYVDQICNVYITNGYLMNRTLSNKQQDGSYPTI